VESGRDLCFSQERYAFPADVTGG